VEIASIRHAVADKLEGYALPSPLIRLLRPVETRFGRRDSRRVPLRKSQREAEIMILPLTLPSASSSTTNTLPPVLAQMGSSEFFLLELQGDLEVSGDKSGQLVGRLTIDSDDDTTTTTTTTTTTKVRLLSKFPFYDLLFFSHAFLDARFFLFRVNRRFGSVITY
jgi:hypothetical protein